MMLAAFWFQSPTTWPTALVAVAAGSFLGLTTLFVIQLRRQVQAAWAETGRIYQRSTQRFTAVGDLLEDVLFEADATRTLTYTNRAFHALTSYHERDLRSGLNLGDLFDPDECGHLMEDLESLRSADDVRVRTYSLRCRDGARVPVSLRLSAMVDEERVVGWRGLLEAISESAADPVARPSYSAEQILGEILQDFEVTPRQEHDGALARGLGLIGSRIGADRCYHYMQSPDGSSLLSHRQWYAPGVSPLRDDQCLPGLTSYPWTRERLIEDGALVVTEVERLAAEEVPERARWLAQGITSLLVVPLRVQGEVVGLLGCETLGRQRRWCRKDRQLLETMAQICQRVQCHDQTSQRLDEAMDRAGDLAELLPEPVAMADSAGILVVWNQALEQLTGRTAAEMRGLSASDAMARVLPGSEDWLQTHLTADDKAAVPGSSGLFEIVDQEGRPTWVQLTLRQLAQDSGWLLHFCDMTAAKRNERLERAVVEQQGELQLAQDQLVESEKMAAVARMVTGLAHEINTPVGVGLTAASHLSDCAEEINRHYQDGLMRRSEFENFLASVRESSCLISDNLQRAVDLVSGMRQAAVDQVIARPRQIPLREYLGDVLLSLGPRLRERHAEVRFDCPGDLTLTADPGVLYRVVSNLVMNSLQHGFDGLLVGEIQITATRSGRGIELLYGDDGRGMTAEQVQRLYEPFFTSARGQGGMGLGMHIVYSLVTHNLGGTITCTSRPGKGTKYRISIPQPQESSAHDPQP